MDDITERSSSGAAPESGRWPRLVRPLYGALAHRNFRRVGECRRLLDWLEAGPGDRILDVGCGDGYYDAVMAKRGARVTGVDIHESRLRRADLLHRSPGADFRRMDAHEMGFDDATFDKVVSMCVVEHFREPYRVFAEMHRVLKPGGSLVFSADSLSLPQVTERERDLHRHRYDVTTFFTIDVLRQRLEELGFEVLEHEYILTTKVTLALVRMSWFFDRSRSLGMRVLNEATNLVFATVGKAISDLSEALARRKDCGLTLLVRARKRGA